MTDGMFRRSPPWIVPSIIDQMWLYVCVCAHVLQPSISNILDFLLPPSHLPSFSAYPYPRSPVHHFSSPTSSKLIMLIHSQYLTWKHICSKFTDTIGDWLLKTLFVMLWEVLDSIWSIKFAKPARDQNKVTLLMECNLLFLYGSDWIYTASLFSHHLNGLKTWRHLDQKTDWCES